MNADIDNLRVGFDTVSINRIAKSIERWGNSFLNRLFTQEEQNYCNAGHGRVRMQRYAVRFAAKEAFVKAWDLFYYNQEPPLKGICFSSLQVHLDEWGRPRLELLGSVKDAFEALEFVISSISLSHDGENACAVAAVIKR